MITIVGPGAAATIKEPSIITKYLHNKTRAVIDPWFCFYSMGVSVSAGSSGVNSSTSSTFIILPSFIER